MIYSCSHNYGYCIVAGGEIYFKKEPQYETNKLKHWVNIFHFGGSL